MSRQHPKNPRQPTQPLTLPAATVAAYDGPMWRIHSPTGRHPSAWNDLRFNGPVPGNRWDPHPGPLSTRSAIGVSYTAPSHITAFAEVFQRDRAITVSRDRVLSGWRPTRRLELLNLLGGPGDGDWAVLHGASASLPQAPKNTCRAWAEAIHDQLGTQLDGLLVPSTVLGDPMVVLLTRAQDAFPVAPELSRSLDHPDVLTLAVAVRDRLGWPIR